MSGVGAVFSSSVVLEVELDVLDVLDVLELELELLDGSSLSSALTVLTTVKQKNVNHNVCLLRVFVSSRRNRILQLTVYNFSVSNTMKK